MICSAQDKGRKGTLQSITTQSLLFQLGVQIFTKRPLEEQQNSFNPDDILTCLKRYPSALVRYLEHLVMDRKLQVSTADLDPECRLQGPALAKRRNLGLNLAGGPCVMFSVPELFSLRWLVVCREPEVVKETGGGRSFSNPVPCPPSS